MNDLTARIRFEAEVASQTWTPDIPESEHQYARLLQIADEVDAALMAVVRVNEKLLSDLRAKVEVLPGNDPFQSPERRDAYEYAINDVLALIDGSSDE